MGGSVFVGVGLRGEGAPTPLPPLRSPGTLVGGLPAQRRLEAPTTTHSLPGRHPSPQSTPSSGSSGSSTANIQAPQVGSSDVGSQWKSRPLPNQAPPHLHDEAAELQAPYEAVVVGVHHVLVGDGHVVLAAHVVRKVVVHDQAEQPFGWSRLGSFGYWG